MTRLAAGLVLLMVATVQADDGGAHLDRRWRLEHSLAFRAGSFQVNGVDLGDAQAGVAVGVRRGRWAAAGEYAYAELGASEETLRRGLVGPASGVVHRLGPVARYTYARVGEGPMSLHAYAELGGGLQHLRWDQGGRWTRADLLVGLGTTTMFTGERRHWGVTFGMRLALSRRSDVPAGAPIACGGPCDAPTPPTGLDRSFMIDTSFHFGT